MKLNFTIILAAALVLPVLSQNLFVEDFNYPERDSLQGVGSWFASGPITPYNVKIKSPGLTYSGYLGSGTGNTAFFSNTPNGSIVLHNFTTQTSGQIYMSFMMKIDSMGVNAVSGYNIGFDQAGGPTYLNTMLKIQKVSPTTYKMGITKTGTTVYGAATYNTGTTYVVVLKYAFVAGTNNDVSGLYVFSSGVPAAEPVTFDASTSDGPDLPDQGQVFLSNMFIQTPGLSGSSVKIDGIRVGTTWENTIINGIKMISSEVPSNFSLEQNYPNPFNPVTKINYSVSKAANVKIKVYDNLAREVIVLVNEYHSPGTYEVELNASNLSSGAYYYVMQAENFVNVKKLVLVK
jgi:hypothetical protein